MVKEGRRPSQCLLMLAAQNEPEAYLARLMQGAASGRDLICALARRETGETIGTCTLYNVHEACRRAEIGFGLHRSFWRNGYMREATNALIEYAFTSQRIGTAGIPRCGSMG
jgi:[ribosomal protein S5]-alanine N-acetyltransferase